MTEALRLLGIESYSLSFSMVTKRAIQNLNRTYRGKNSATDVLSFPQLEWKKAYDPRKHMDFRSCLSPISKMAQVEGIPTALGDIVLCPDLAKSNAVKIGQSLDAEVRFLIVHSLLHLVGHDHMESKEEKLMLSLQRFFMTCLSKRDLRIRPLVREVAL